MVSLSKHELVAVRRLTVRPWARSFFSILLAARRKQKIRQVQRRQESDQVARFVGADHFKADQIRACMRDLDSARVVNHMLDSPRSDRDGAAFRVVAYAVKRDVLDFLLRAQVLTHDFYSDLVGIFRTRDVVKDVIPIFLLEVKVLHGEDLLSGRDHQCLKVS
jgi:hypothetical protein